jgi:pimeloyl-ACP methyl ester carboxylesterase
VAGVAGLSVPFLHRGPRPPTQMMRAVYGDQFFYMLYFQQPDVPDADLGRDAATTMRRMLLSAGRVGDSLIAAMSSDAEGFVDRLPEPDGLPDWISADELATYVDTFSRTGFTGAINWYRNLDRNWELTEHLAERKVEVPSLFVGGGADPVLLMTPPSTMDGWVTDHRGDVIVPGAGHWVQQQAPDEVNAALVGFVESVRGDGS